MSLKRTIDAILTHGDGYLLDPEELKLRTELTWLRDADYADLTICCQGRIIKAHRHVLASRCKFFKCCLERGFKEGEDGIVHMEDDDPDALEDLLIYIYTLSDCFLWYRRDVAAEKRNDAYKHLIQLYLLSDKYDQPMLTHSLRPRIRAGLEVTAYGGTTSLISILHAIQPLYDVGDSKAAVLLRRSIIERFADPTVPWSKMPDWSVETVAGRETSTPSDSEVRSYDERLADKFEKSAESISGFLTRHPPIFKDVLQAWAKRSIASEKEDSGPGSEP